MPVCPSPSFPSLAPDHPIEASGPHQIRSGHPHHDFTPIHRQYVRDFLVSSVYLCLCPCVCVSVCLCVCVSVCLCSSPLSRCSFRFFATSRLGHCQDDRRLYMLLEYVPGGELFSHLRQQRKYEKEESGRVFGFQKLCCDTPISPPLPPSRLRTQVPQRHRQVLRRRNHQLVSALAQLQHCVP